MHFAIYVYLAPSIVALGSAIPALLSQSTDFCPGMSHITRDIKCSSGFSGCVAYDKGSEVCNGVKRFFKDCSAVPGLGSFYNCANGFVGCTNNSRICDLKLSKPSVNPSVQTRSEISSASPGVCRPGEGYWYVCANGFKGCSTNQHVCDEKVSGPVSSPSNQNLPSVSTECPAGSSYYVCYNNGFRGCSSDPRICDMPSTPKSITPSLHSFSWTCPQNTRYIRPNECSSGFVGCTGETKVCGGEKRFFGTCPPSHGNYYNCASGFVGCTADIKICG